MGLLNGQVINEGDFKTTTAGSADAGVAPKADADGYLDATWLRKAIAAARTFGETISARDAVIVSDGLTSATDVNQSASDTTQAHSTGTRVAQTFVIGSASAVSLISVQMQASNINSSPAYSWQLRTGHTIGGGTLIGSGTGSSGGTVSPFDLTMTPTGGSYPAVLGDQFHYIFWMTSGWCDNRGWAAGSVYSGGAAYYSTDGGASYPAHGTIDDWKFNTSVGTRTAGRIYKAQSGTKEDFIGFALEAGTVGQSKFVQSAAGSIVSGFSGLTPGADYYIDNTTAGAITTATTTGKKVGIAVSTTELMIKLT